MTLICSTTKRNPRRQEVGPEQLAEMDSIMDALLNLKPEVLGKMMNVPVKGTTTDMTLDVLVDMYGADATGQYVTWLAQTIQH